VGSIITAATEIPTSHSGGHPWWAVALITFGAIIVLGVVLTAMTLSDRKRHPHTHG
jgi:hypothetical protein